MLLHGVKKIASKLSNVATSNHNLNLQVDGISNMFDFKVSTHAHYDDACRKFAFTHNMEDVAQQAGMRAQTLRNKLNPDQPHQLTVQEALPSSHHFGGFFHAAVKRMWMHDSA